MVDNQIENNVHDQKIFQHYLKVHNKNEGSPSCFLIFFQNQNPSHQLFQHNPIDHHYFYHPIPEGH